MPSCSIYEYISLFIESSNLADAGRYENVLHNPQSGPCIKNSCLLCSYFYTMYHILYSSEHNLCKSYKKRKHMEMTLMNNYRRML